MSNLIDSNVTINTLKQALNGLARQGEMVGQNLANVDTPGYKAQNVDFKSALKRAVNGNPNIKMVSTNARHMAASGTEQSRMQISLRKGGTQRADGNNVDVDVELTQMTETVIQYQALSQLVSKKLAGLMSIVTGR